VDVEGEKAQEAIVESSESRIGATLAGLNLEEPDADIDCETEGAGMLDVVFGGEFAYGDALTRTDLFINAALLCERRPSRLGNRWQCTHEYPFLLLIRS